MCGVSVGVSPISAFFFVLFLLPVENIVSSLALCQDLLLNIAQIVRVLCLSFQIAIRLGVCVCYATHENNGDVQCTYNRMDRRSVSVSK